MSKKCVRCDEDCKPPAPVLITTAKHGPHSKKYGVSASALSSWSRRCPSVKLMTVSYAPALAYRAKKRDAQPEEKNLILKKRLP